MGQKTNYLIIGKVLKPFGVKGELKLLPITDNLERFHSLESVYIRKGAVFQKNGVETVRFLNKFVLLKLKNCDSRNIVEQLRGQYLYIDREHAAKIDTSSFYYHDLIGCTVITQKGDVIGTVFDIQNAGSSDVYFVRSQDKKQREILLPAISDVIKKIDIRKKEIIIEVIEGLL